MNNTSEESFKNKLEAKFKTVTLVPGTFTHLNETCETTCSLHGKLKVRKAKQILNTSFGCEQCSYIARSDNYTGKVLKDNNQEKINKEYGKDLYTFIKIDSRKATIICKTHDEQKPRYIDSILKSPCSMCIKDNKDFAKQIKLKDKRSRTESNKERILPFDKIYEKLSDEYKYKYLYNISTYINGRTKMQILCNIHGAFWTTLNEHKKSVIGCPNCNNLNKSKQEEAWLKNLDLPLEYQFKIQIARK